MQVTPLDTERRPEAMADVPGVCELPLTRAVVQYRDVHEVELAGGRIQDIGLALVLEGRYASSAEAVDLGSADVRLLDLSGELVILDWVYEPTLEHVNELVRRAAAEGESAPLRSFCFSTALRVLERVGFGPLTRPSVLRIGFRDICRDLDLHEGTSVRLVLGPGRVTRAHLDYDGNALVFRTASAAVDRELEEVLLAAFPAGDLRRLLPGGPGGEAGYQVRFPLSLTLDEARAFLGSVRAGLARLFARFEPERFGAVERVVDTFGQRETLARLRIAPDRTRYLAVRRASGSVGGSIH